MRNQQTCDQCGHVELNHTRLLQFCPKCRMTNSFKWTIRKINSLEEKFNQIRQSLESEQKELL